MNGTGNELAVREGTVITPMERASAATALAGSGSIHAWLIVMKDVTLLAEHICDTAFVPKAIRGNAPAVAAAILAGMELDLPPMTALRHVQVVEGSPSLSAEYKRARVLAAGHRLDITERTAEACTVTGHRKGHESVTVRYTIEDARKAGLVKDRGAYVTRPRRMLFARASTEVCDALFADITNGLPTAELLDEDSEDGFGGYDEQPAQPARQRVTAAQAKARVPQTVTATVETVTPDVPPAPPAAPPAEAASPAPVESESAGGTPDDQQPATTDQLKAISRQLEDLGYPGDDQRAARLRVVALIARKPADTLTRADARKVYDTLEGLDAAALDGILAEIAMADDPRDEEPAGA